jgi:periplasmic protein TonB
MFHSMFVRVAGAIALGVATTAAVVLLMQVLIEPDHLSLDEAPPGATLTFLPLIEEIPADPRPPKPVEPDKPVKPPPPPDVTTRDPFGPTIGTSFGPPPVDGPLGPTRIGVMADGDALPVVKVSPVYPTRAQQQGVEGYVLVQFTIDELGRVMDVEVIEAEPRGMFERAALKAVERFRYRPRVVNGHATSVNGVQHLVTFELSS